MFFDVFLHVSLELLAESQFVVLIVAGSRVELLFD